MNALGEYWKQMFNYTSSTGRKSFWIGYAGNFVIIFVLYLIYSGILGLVAGFNGGDDKTIETILFSLFILVYLIYSVAGLSARVRRLRDAGFSPWLILLVIVPLLSTVVFVLLFFPTKQSQYTQLNQGE